MLIKKAINQNCSKCGRYEKEISPEQYGCDQCRKSIVSFGNDEWLDVRVFHHSAKTETYYFCSWRCVFEFVRKLKGAEYFFTLPYVSAENKISGRRAKDFFAILSEHNRRKP